MTVEKILTQMNEILNGMDEDFKSNVEYSLKRNVFLDDSAGKFAKFIKELQEEVFKSEAKKDGKGSALAAAKRTLKFSRKECIKEVAWYADDRTGEQVIMGSGYYGVSLVENDKLPLEPMPEEIKNNSEPLKIRKYILNTNDRNGEKLALLELKKLKYALRIKKAEVGKLKNGEHILIDFGTILLNLEFLINTIEMLGDEGITATYYSDKHPLIIENSNGSIGVVCPINPARRTKEGCEKLIIKANEL